ncbi:MAG: cytochrome c-type biogenesis protein CcmH [Minwuia sp.]|nr:cytochrome c-type biogenesis protein CcmH [Minwuia sp.]
MTRTPATPLIALMLVLFSLPALAIFTEKLLPDTEQEARAQELMRDFRCLVCQNQAISESHADLARDMRVIVRERIIAGDDDDAVRQYFVTRYGDWVLLDPPLNSKTIFLWAGGGLILLIGAALVYFRMRRAPKVTAGHLSLSATEKDELERLMREQG